MNDLSETIPLQYPIEANGVKTERLTLRRPTVGDLLNSGQGGRSSQEAEVHLLADLCGVSPDDIRRLDMADYFTLQDALGKMQRPAPTSSGKPS